jgi:hypothetical protein
LAAIDREGPGELMDPGSVYHLVLGQPGVDRSNMVSQESWWRAIEDEMEAAI